MISQLSSAIGSTLVIVVLSASPLVVSVPAHAGKIGEVASPIDLKSPNIADCAEANSDYERYELGCSTDEGGGKRTEEPVSIRSGSPALSNLRQTD